MTRTLKSSQGLRDSHMEHENLGWLWWGTGTIWLLKILAAFPHSYPEWGKALHITGLSEWSLLLFIPWRLKSQLCPRPRMTLPRNPVPPFHARAQCSLTLRPGSQRLPSPPNPHSGETGFLGWENGRNRVEAAPMSRKRWLNRTTGGTSLSGRAVPGGFTRTRQLKED